MLMCDLDLSVIERRMIVKHGWTQKRASRALQAYRKFLQQHREAPEESHEPTADADAVWHEHILDTQRYAADCEEYFGFFLDHIPQDAPFSLWRDWLSRMFGFTPVLRATCGSGGNQGT